MRKFFGVLAAGALIFAITAGAPAQNRSNRATPGHIVIVFKDGHRQSFNLSDISRIEFPGGSAFADAGSTPPDAPPRGHFLGRWAVGDGTGNTFYITLKENGEAFRSLGNIHGKWAYINGEARVTWDDGAQDAIRHVGNRDMKFAYRGGKAFTDEPDNVTDAHNTSPRPI